MRVNLTAHVCIEFYAAVFPRLLLMVNYYGRENLNQKIGPPGFGPYENLLHLLFYLADSEVGKNKI
jgi:hypothetical protein